MHSSAERAPAKPSFTYRAAALIISGAMLGPNKLSISGQENLPSDGPFVMAFTHHNSWDVPATALAVLQTSKRQVDYLANQKFFENPYLRKLFNSLGGIAINTEEVDSEQLLIAARILKDGGILGVAAENGRENGFDVTDVGSAVGLVALMGAAEVVPVGAAGHQDVYNIRPRAVHVHFGNRLAPDYKLPPNFHIENLRAIRDLPREAIQSIRRFKPELKTAAQASLDESIKGYVRINGEYPRIGPPIPDKIKRTDAK